LDSKGNAKICDFGLSCKLENDNKIKSICGGQLSQAPEMLQGFYDHSVDYWSLGIAMFFMLTGTYPFYENKAINWTVQMSILNANLPNMNEKRKEINSDYPNISENACDFVAKLLVKDPTQRLGSRTNSQDIKSHPFYDKIDWEQLENGEIKPPLQPDVLNYVFRKDAFFYYKFFNYN
jgi:hypothetical protein